MSGELLLIFIMNACQHPQELHKESLQVKLDANAAFKSGQYDEAISKYTLALLTCPLCHSKDRSVLYSNRAAAHMRLVSVSHIFLMSDLAVYFL